MLLKGVSDIIKYLGRAVMAATTDDFLQPYIQQAQDDIIERALGAEFIEVLQEELDAGTLTPANQKVLVKIQKALAWYAYLKYLPFSIGNDGDNGLMEISGEKNAPVRIGVLDKRMRESEKNAISSLESLLVFLENNLEDYPEYRFSVFVLKTRTFFIPSATVMSQFIPSIDGNYRLFLTLKPYLSLSERDFILPRIGKDQYGKLKVAISEGNLTPDEEDLLFAIRRALAHTAYAIALPDMQFTLNGSGNIRVLSDFDGIYNSKAADSDTIDRTMATARTDAKKWQNYLQGFLTKNIEKFPLYKAAQASKEQPLNKLPDNEPYKTVFRLK